MVLVGWFLVGGSCQVGPTRLLQFYPFRTCTQGSQLSSDDTVEKDLKGTTNHVDRREVYIIW